MKYLNVIKKFDSTGFEMPANLTISITYDEFQFIKGLLSKSKTADNVVIESVRIGLIDQFSRY